MRNYTAKPVDAKITGTIKGYMLEGESKTEAQTRIVFEAERRVNEYADIRAHLSMEQIAETENNT